MICRKKMFCAARISAVLFLFARGALADEAPIDWPAFLSRHDMTFDRLPQGWKEAPHFGNAMLGSMLYQMDDTICLQVFRADVHDHRDNTWGWTAYSRPRLQIGNFSLHPVGQLTGCRWRKDLWNAELTGTITTDRGEIRIRHFTHAEDMAIVTELAPSAGEKGFTWTWRPVAAETTRGGYPRDAEGIAAFAKKYGSHYADTLKPFKPNPPGRLETKDGVSVWIQDFLVGGQYATAWKEQASGDTRTLVVSIANSHPEATAAETAAVEVEWFLEKDRKDWIETHRSWWHDYYPRSFVTIPDQGLESLYWQTIYRFGCTTRTGRCWVDTPGIWFQGRAWPYSTADWNIQSAHWPVYAANRLEQGQVLVDRLHQQRRELIKAVRPVEWQEDSAYLPLAVTWDMRGNREGDMRYYHLVGNLPWAMHNAWWQYRYSMDDEMLREKIYPLLRRGINFYLHMVEEEEDGTLRLPPTFSPELGVFADCNFDLALFEWGCHTLLTASDRLGIDDPLIPRWKQVVERLPDYPADEHGYMLGRDRTSSANHQHFSNLLMIYPLYLVNREQPGTAEAMRRSYDRAKATAGPGQRQAMVQAHAGPIATALGLGDEALDSLRRLAGDLLPNGLWYDPPCLESSLAAANIVQEMLLQSWSDPTAETPGPIRVFPAVPSVWKDVEFRRLRAEGAFLVSAKLEDGKTKWVRIKSLTGEPCRVRPGFDGPFEIESARTLKLAQVEPEVYDIDLRKGEEVLLIGEAGP
jgi:alpha-L-fucosidase 2